jgi:peptidoglycan-N-acetylglucosamine deacetylase
MAADAMTRHGRPTRRSVRVASAVVALLVGLLAVHRFVDARTVQLFGTIVPRVETSARLVALTFDDGPTAPELEEVIGILADRNVRATFFVNGSHLDEDLATGRRLVEAGHELGNHTYSHPRMLLRSPAFIREEVERTDALIRLAGHRGEIYFRPPYGKKLVGLPWYLSRNRRTTVTWDVEPESDRANAGDAERLASAALAAVRPGSIVLLHPWYPVNAATRAAVPLVIDRLHAEGYDIVPVRELLARAAAGH